MVWTPFYPPDGFLPSDLSPEAAREIAALIPQWWPIPVYWGDRREEIFDDIGRSVSYPLQGNYSVPWPPTDGCIEYETAVANGAVWSAAHSTGLSVFKPGRSVPGYPGAHYDIKHMDTFAERLIVALDETYPTWRGKIYRMDADTHPNESAEENLEETAVLLRAIEMMSARGVILNRGHGHPAEEIASWARRPGVTGLCYEHVYWPDEYGSRTKAEALIAAFPRRNVLTISVQGGEGHEEEIAAWVRAVRRYKHVGVYLTVNGSVQPWHEAFRRRQASSPSSS